MRIDTVLIVISLCCFTGTVSASDKNIDFGKREYLNSCAVCHGTDGKAQTQIRDSLKVAPADLSQLSKKNEGVFPMERVYETIDGRLAVKMHGTRDMPIWGRRFYVEATPIYDDFPYDAEAFVRARILGLIEYIHRLQEK